VSFDRVEYGLGDYLAHFLFELTKQFGHVDSLGQDEQLPLSQRARKMAPRVVLARVEYGKQVFDAQERVLVAISQAEREFAKRNYVQMQVLYALGRVGSQHALAQLILQVQVVIQLFVVD